uniref:Netrin receptor DCC n=1 Tax=Echinococcus granulosus TaxID=6210 RepID=A0A068X313_ECHGR|nr:Netrin receptor DCC [Echinococcus granulosus]
MGRFFVSPIYLFLPAFLLIANCEQRVILLCQWANNGFSQISPKLLQCRSAYNQSSYMPYRLTEASIKMDSGYRLCSELNSMQKNTGPCFDDCIQQESAKGVVRFNCRFKRESNFDEIVISRQKRLALPPPNPPGDLEIVSVAEDSAQLSWQPPQPIFESLNEQINYRIEIKPENSPKKFSMMTEESQILFEELRPNTLYEVSVYSYRPADGQASQTPKHIKVTTKSEVYRLPMVMNPKAESTDFATLKVSWELPHIERSDRPEAQIGHYRQDETNNIVLTNFCLMIVLLNLAASSGDSRRWVSYKVPGGARVTAYTIADLQPDSFYRVRIIAVSVVGVDGHPATIASSPRILSRPPSSPPAKVMLSAVGALTAAFSWLPPAVQDRNGEIVAYQLEFNSPEWLAPRELTVADGCNYTITGLNPMTNYSLNVAAATRAGVGPKSPPLLFMTALKSNQIDSEAPSDPNDTGFDSHNFFADPGVATLPPLKVHNLRYIARERNILLLWSIPPISASPHRFKGVVVRWGNIYPGPNKAEVSLEKRAFSIEPLEPSTTYMISVALLIEDGEGPIEMITAQTKPVSHAKESLIPLNFRLLSAGPDWAIMAWDAPTCSALEDEFDVYHGNSNRRTTQRASPCASGAFPLTYQLRYEAVEMGDAATTNGAFGNCPEDGSSTAKDVDVNVTWARLEQLQPSSHYVACVRAITHDAAQTELIGDWSFVHIFETQHQEPSQVDLSRIAKSGVTNTSQLSASSSNYLPSTPITNASVSLADGSRSSTLIGGGNSDIWLALAAIMVTTIVLMVIVIVVVCWAKRSPIMVVGYKPEQQVGGGGLTEASVNLISPSKCQSNGGEGGGKGGVNEKIALQQYPLPKSSEAQLIDFTSKAPEAWTIDGESAIHQQQQQHQQGLMSMTNAVPMMGIRSAVDPMSGCGSDAASRGATGSSASSAISLLPAVGTTGMKQTPTYASPTGNSLISPPASVPPYGIFPSAQPQLGTFAQAYYHQHHQNATAAAASGGGIGGGMYPPPSYLRGATGQHPPPPPPHQPPPPAFPLVTPSNIGGPRIDLSAGENDGTYLQYPGLPINRGHIAPNTPSINASDLISESSSGVPSSVVLGIAATTHPTVPAGGSGNPVEFSTVSTVSSCSNSNSNASNHHLQAANPHIQRQMAHLQQRGGYNSLPARKDGVKNTNEAKSRAAAGGGETNANMKAISTEELTQEMANLDGLMKDLSMITQNEFGCLQP